ncbi:thymidine kinase [Microbacterium ulmi]|uniref:Thymidine kinase n=1 Tax=Microbacterium ulmi TaxID=179095 RepID=A0A7Y2M258_9MICO|nr:thymidine kinase [Microbacterium ulmi]NII68883.1 thymidine kinase [Microbacterium ulmi]NNH05121.1 thymidine kinase [Microbacterium ulmi]
MHTRTQARLQVVAGPMFAGKSEELMRRVRRARIAGLAVEVVSHALDDRRGAGQVSSHSGLSVPSHAVADVDALVAAVRARRLDIVAIDEAQFFGHGLVAAVDELVADGVMVIVAGLCVTFDGRPFEPLPALMAVAEDVVKLTAVCAVCGEDAAFHERILAGDVGDPNVPTRAQVGGVETYQARCRRHFRGGPRAPA